MMAAMRLRLAALTLALSLAACSDKQCDPQPAPPAWKPYEPLLPANVTLCGSTRMTQGQTIDTPSDTMLFLYYNERSNVADAFSETVDRFVAAGWVLDDMQIVGEGKSALYDAVLSKDGVAIDIGVNENDFGMQGAFSLRLPPPP
jgi:hypothetical protein